MGDLTAQKKRLKLYKDFLKSAGKWNSNPKYLKHVPGYDPGSLERAAAFFGLDHADPSHLMLLTLILADVLFGKRRPGRQKGVKTTWDERKSWELVWTYSDLRSRHPDRSDAEIAKLICDRKEFKAYKSNPETIRQRLPEVMKFGLSDDSGIWKAVWPDVDDCSEQVDDD
jgi:hypothetical protein